MHRRLTAVLTMAVLLVLTAGLLASYAPKDEGITSQDQLNQPDIKIGVATDTTEYMIVQEKFPQAEIVYTKDLMASYTSVAQGKIDAFVGNKLNMELAIFNGLKGVRLLDGTVGQGNTCAVAISPVTKIPELKERLNEFLKQVKDDGTIDDMRARWMEKHEMVMPDIPEAKDPQYHLVVGTSGLSEPFTCYVNGELSGYDIEARQAVRGMAGGEPRVQGVRLRGHHTGRPGRRCRLHLREPLRHP